MSLNAQECVTLWPDPRAAGALMEMEKLLQLQGSGCMAGLSHFPQLLLFQLKALGFFPSTAELTQRV